VPGAVLEFLGRLELPQGTWLGALAVNAGQVSRTLLQLDHACARRGWRLKAGWSLVMPSNYIPWGGPGSEALMRRRFDEAGAKLRAIAPLIREGRSAPVERGPLWQRVLFTALYRMSFSKVPALDRHFWTDAKCSAPPPISPWRTAGPSGSTIATSAWPASNGARGRLSNTARRPRPTPDTIIPR